MWTECSKGKLTFLNKRVIRKYQSQEQQSTWGEVLVEEVEERDGTITAIQHIEASYHIVCWIGEWPWLGIKNAEKIQAS